MSETICYLDLKFGQHMSKTNGYNFSSLTKAQFRGKKAQTGAPLKPNPTRILIEHAGVFEPCLPIYLCDHYDWGGVG